MMSRSVPAADGCGACAAALALLCAALVPLPSRAQSSDAVELTWRVPGGCPSSADVQARIRKLAGSASAGATPLRAEATITRGEGGRLQLKLIVRTGSSAAERIIEGRSCDDLAGATAVSLALLLKPVAAREAAGPDVSAAAPAENASTAPAPPAPANTESAQIVPPAPAPSVADDTPSTTRVEGVLLLPLFALQLGRLPQPSFGFALAGGVWIERWRILAAGTLWLPQELTMAKRPEIGATIERVDASLQACWAFPFGRFEAAPCVRVALEHVWARGTGAHVEAHTAESTGFAAGLGLAARLRLAPWFNLLGAVEARLDTSRPEITIEGVGRIGQLGPGALEIGIGSEWIL
jgi:hypothetical protein